MWRGDDSAGCGAQQKVREAPFVKFFERLLETEIGKTGRFFSVEGVISPASIPLEEKKRQGRDR
ncbi:hypothetical protein LN995_12825, partial [Pontibacter silvestris]|nr:hypothetical protein [Pontibacter silvestris]